MRNKIFAAAGLVLILFVSPGPAWSASPKASLLYKLQLEPHSMPADVVVETNGGTGVYDAFSGGYLTYDGNGRALDSVRKDFLKNGNCLVKSKNNFFFCNSADASLDILSNNLEKSASFRLPSNMKGQYDPTDALVDQSYVYSVDNDNHRIIKTDITTKHVDLSVGSYGRSKLSFWYPYALAVDSKGILYVSEVMNTRVQKITQDLKFYEFIGEWGIKGGEFYRPTGIAVYEGGTLLVADGYLGIIQCLDMDGKFTGLLSDTSGKKLELGSITHLRVNANILAVVDAFHKRVCVYELKRQ